MSCQFKKEHPSHDGKDGKVGISFMNEFNSVVRRFLTKIAFNYMAWVRGPEFTLRQDLRCQLFSPKIRDAVWIVVHEIKSDIWGAGGKLL